MMTDSNEKLSRWCLPIVYLGAWFLFTLLTTKFIARNLYNNEYYWWISFLVFSIAIISRSTFWLIGHEKFGIQGDSRARLLNYHKGKDSWFDLFADKAGSLKDKEIKSLIQLLIKTK